MSTETLNSLAKASSAYLRSAMHQPIQWHEWGEEAFAKARRENKPILLDIGAVWCHWCHVMDRESYDDPAIAQIVNERFIPVKVDRDERPEIDSRYQIAVSSISGQGGWPLTAFLTPDGKPFYGGTYFPRQDHYGRPSFQRVLLAISDAFREKSDEVTEQARLVESSIAQAESFAGRNADFSASVIDAINKSAITMFDPQHGGFGNAPKFPHSSAIDLLIDSHVRTSDPETRNVFVTTLEKMARGGVYDQLAGGFHRYSVDERWVVPHFEKMSYDNSELLKNYVHAYQATGSVFFSDVARDIIRWIDEWLSDRDRGGFYASQDADYSMEDDGDYFTWTLAEARAVLSEDETLVAALHYDIKEVGEMHHNPGKNVLYQSLALEEVASRLQLPLEQVRELLASTKQKMYAARLRRPTPYVDKTVYVGWNSMMISAYLQSARVLNLPDAGRFALRSLDRILSQGWRHGSALVHVLAYSDPNAEHRSVDGLLDDYAFTVNACLDAYEGTADLSYFKFARSLAGAMTDRFFDPVGGGFFDSSSSAGDALGVLGTRRKPFQDSPTPAGNPVAAIALLRLYAFTNEPDYRDKAEQTLEVFAGTAAQYGMFAGTYGIAAVYFSQPHTQVVIIGEDAAAEELQRVASQSFIFNKEVLKLTFNEAVEQNLPPALAQTIPALPILQGKESVAVVCSNFACLPPFSTADELRRTLNSRPEVA